MADRLYLSYWIRGYTEHNMLRHWERMLRRFPFSRLRPKAELRVHGVSRNEPALLVQEFAGDGWIDGVLAAAAEYRHPDVACVLESAWDIWNFAAPSAEGENGEADWKLAPATVLLTAYGLLSPSDQGEQLLIEFGSDAPFLPAAEQGGRIAPVRHNIRGLLHLVQELDGALAVQKRRLWSESGENFAERLQAALQER